MIDPRLRHFLSVTVAGSALLAGFALFSPLAAQQDEEAPPPSTLVGRVVDLDGSIPVTDAVVHLEEGDFRTVTNEEGLFRFAHVPAGAHVLLVQHVAYGVQRDTIHVASDETVAVRVTVTRRPIELGPVVVSVMSTAERERRARGTRRNEITRSRIRMAVAGPTTLGGLIGDEIPGAWVKDRPSRPGEDICLEVRQPASVQHARSCKYPLVVIDGVRVQNPGFVLTTMDLEEVERVQVLSPAAAGLLYGTGSGWGVVVIETRRGLPRGDARDGEEVPPYALGESSVYPWELEPGSHPWGKAFVGGVLGNALGLASGILFASRCLDITDADAEAFRVDCGVWGTVGSQLAVTGLPIVGTALGARLGGRTQASRGEFLPAALASAAAMIPGYVVATSGTGTSSVVQWVGAGIVSLGMPAAAMLADRLFRDFDP